MISFTISAFILISFVIFLIGVMIGIWFVMIKMK